MSSGSWRKTIRVSVGVGVTDSVTVAVIVTDGIAVLVAVGV
jgi:hypothetical protein